MADCISSLYKLYSTLVKTTFGVWYLYSYLIHTLQPLQVFGGGIQERTVGLRFPGIISRVLRLEVSTLVLCLLQGALHEQTWVFFIDRARDCQKQRGGVQGWYSQRDSISYRTVKTGTLLIAQIQGYLVGLKSTKILIVTCNNLYNINY